jgi:hypothetical protein
MKIHLATKQVLRPDVNGKNKKAYAIYREETGRAEAYGTLDWVELGMPDFTQPTVGEDQKIVKEPIDHVDGGKTWQVVDLTAQELIDREQAAADAAKAQLASDLQQATISSAILITEVFSILNADGILNVQGLSDKAKEEFATLTALVDQYTT